MTINGPAPWLFACYLVAAERQGVAWSSLEGTLQTDIFKEYTAQKEWLFPPRPHLRLIADLMAFCAERVPKYHPLSVSGYHIREAGSTAAQELAFTLADGFAYVELGLQRGLPIDAFAPQLSFFFDATSTSSKRSRSSGPRAASGRGGCATGTGPSIPRRSVSGSTRRRPACPSPPSSR